jgi:TraM recognition site of TraD and TraG
VLKQVTDPVVKSFWTEEFSRYHDKMLAEAISPIQNKVGQFLSSPLIRNVVGQTRSTFSVREAMDRVDMPQAERKDFYLYVDEFQNFATESFANILSEARKYRLNLILAHQFIAQLDEVVRDAVFGNVGTLVSFRVGAMDAEILEKEFRPVFFSNDLINLGKYSIYLKLMINGVANRSFSAATLPPVDMGDTQANAEKIIRVSRERYGKSRKVVEEKIYRWSGLKK